MPLITIDGEEYDVKSGDNILQAFLSLGLDLPYFCWHPAMGSIGACRQCAVVQYLNADDDRGRIVMGCMTPVTEGAIFSLQGDKAKQFRQTIVESLMLNHPHDCPVCAEGGECHLQDVTVMTGHNTRQYRGLKNTHRNQYLGPLIHHEMNRCITCYRCTRYYRDYAGGTDLAAMASRDHVYFGRHQEGVLESEFSGNLVEVCPTGVFTDETLVNEYTRKWDLQSAPSVCTGCAVGCNTLVGERYGKLKRVHNRYNADVNGYFLCDRGRFGAAFVNNEQRLDHAGLRNIDGRYDAIERQQAVDTMAAVCGEGKLACIGSPRASVEANYLLRTLVGAENFSSGCSDQEQPLINLSCQLLQKSSAQIPDIKTIESADAILILGEDLTNTAPRIALALRQSVRNKAYAMAAELRLQPWQDAAVRNLAQDQLNPLFIAAVSDTRLDDIAQQTAHMAPDDIARLTAVITAKISGKAIGPLKSLVDEKLATTIAEVLAAAKRPLIISGTSCANSAMISEAALLADSLSDSGRQPMLCLTVPEANSLGQAMLTGDHAVNLETLTARAVAGDITTLVVVENDLYRRGRKADIDKLLANVANIVVLDCLDNATMSASSLALPAASFIETEGTLVSLEGRAQRYFAAMTAHADRQASWQWLLSCMHSMGILAVSEVHHFDDISQACARTIPALAGILAAAPDHHYRNLGVKIPRQTHRYSGRTAMLANKSVHEPKQTIDEESALAFSMEGLNHNQPAALLTYVWSPGWNSNQSLHKFQDEVGGPIKGGSAGARLLITASTNTKIVAIETAKPPSFMPSEDQWLLVPRHKIFGSDELSAHSAAIEKLIDVAVIEISTDDAERLNVVNGDGLIIGDPSAADVLEVRLNDSIALGCAAYSVGLNESLNLVNGERVSLQKDTQWIRQKPELIASDGVAHV
ncbi:MAG: NADH-quinone oxidoreductase subunit G [Oceanicoccus sp.]|jgi:NADH-quinone oxidoreductase subunit G